MNSQQEVLNLSEYFYSMQGEGRYSGTPAIFFRFMFCNLKCSWCDSVLEDTLVRTSNKEWVPIQDLRVGANILGVDREKNHPLRNRYKYVEASSTHLVDHIGTSAIEILFDNDSQLAVTPNHLIFVKRKGERWSWIKAEDLVVGDIVWSVGKEVVVSESEDYIEGWLQGYTDGDAHYTSKWTRWETITPEIYERTQLYLKKTNHDYWPRKSTVETVSGNSIYEIDCNKYRVSLKDTLEWKRGYVSGFFDAEGSNNDVQPVFSNNDRDYLLRCQQYLQEFGYTSRMAQIGSCFTLSVKSSFSKRLEFDSFFDYSKPHYRKWLWNEKGVRGAVRNCKFRMSKEKRKIVSARRLRGKFRFYDISSTSGNFVANGILVHNSKYTWDAKNFDLKKESNPMAIKQMVSYVAQKPRSAHIILTGGEPLLKMHADSQIEFLRELRRTGIDSFIEVETAGTIVPPRELDLLINHYNVSMKLSNSGNAKDRRFPGISPSFFSLLCDRADFKFVITKESDLIEVQDEFERKLPKLTPDRIYLMPEGISAKELAEKRPWLMEICKLYGYNFSDRLQVLVYGNRRGV